MATGAASVFGLDASAASGFGVIAGAAMNNMVANNKDKAEEMAKQIGSSRLALLRYYFDVNNAYVLKKLQILMLPFRHHEWERQHSADGTGEMRPPSLDPNAPDLYLPLMGFLTYILVAGFVSGADGRFTPEVLWQTGSSGSVIVIIEVGLIKLALYLLQSEGGGAPSLDLVSCSGYKFIAAVLVLLAKTFLGAVAGYVAILACGASIGTFMVQTIRQCLVQGSGFTPGFMTNGMGSPGRKEKRTKQTYSLMAVACLQPLFFWYLSRV